MPVYAAAYKKTALKTYQAVLSPETPLAAMTKAKRDRAWVKICEEIEALNSPKESSSEKWRAVDEEEKSAQVQSERDIEGFYTEVGIKWLIDETSLSGERSEGAILIYKTQKQHTWLIARYLKLYCMSMILIGAKVVISSNGRCHCMNANPIKITDSDKPNSGFLNIGRRKDWYYSKCLFPTDGVLMQAIKRLILAGKSARQEDKMPPP